MRLLHTSDWHLGRKIRRESRQPECERVLAEVTRIVRDESIDVVVIAGDTFDSLSPGAEAERLAYETLGEIVRDGAQVVMIAGNHDSPHHMDALTSILRMVGVHTVGSVPEQAEDAIIAVPSRNRSETATFAALPWVPERIALQFETLFEGADNARTEYRQVMEALIPRCFSRFSDDTINVFVGHMLIDGSEIGEGGGERKLHIGHNFAVNAGCIPATAHYVALGHVHKRQAIVAQSPTFYAGSLLQLDFGEGGQKKYVNVVDAKPRQPADIRPIEITGGRGLQTVTLDFDDLTSHAGKYGDDYLRVIVRADRPLPSLFEQVREVLPNALDVAFERTDESAQTASDASKHGLAPYELLARYYRERHSAEAPEALIALFNELYEAEAGHAPA
ncbi:MAG: exonuclease SbcCD subunit D [Dehalococcoidia bacterium]